MANEPACTEERFLGDISKHEMIVLRDDGVYRHLQFKRPWSSSFYFDLVTYPGHLVMSGDMGAYVFTRLDDMFQFFRSDKGKINPGYWSEKLVAVDCNGRQDGSSMTYNPEAIKDLIKEKRLEWIRERNVDKEERRELWNCLQRLMDSLEGNQTTDYHDVNDWSWTPFGHDHRHPGSCHFSDLWDHNFKEYSFHFLWACYAIAWGIKTYDASKEAVELGHGS